ncbi:MAG: peptidylprolyl isomerase [Brachymonas sp.]|nr:peptidylprolyl isomerase [Brachymonas sp.]
MSDSNTHPEAETDAITPSSVVALTWTLKDMQGEVLDTLEEAVEFFLGGDDLLPSIVAALLQRRAGDTLQLHLEPEHAFGDYDENLVFVEPRSAFPPELEEGMVFEGHALPETGNGKLPPDALYIVTDIYPEHVILDGNHPLAGIGLDLELQIERVRPATAEEIQRGSAGTGFFRVATQAEQEGQTLH